MKKTLLAIAAMVAMVACNNDYVVKEAAPEAISFENMFVDNATRSVNDPSLTVDTINDFAVYGYVQNGTNNAVLFDGTKVYKNDSSKWQYDGIQYWINGATYNFNAVAPMTGGNWTVVKTDADGNVVTDATKTTLSFTNDGETDLLYAKSPAIIREATSEDAVAFTFRHTLSKVKFSFTNGYNATNSSIRVKNIKIKDAHKTATVVLGDATTWSNQANNLELSFGNAAVGAVDAEEAIAYTKTVESYKELFLIPGASDTDVTIINADGTQTIKNDVYTVTFTVELLMNGDVLGSYNHKVYTTFAPEAGKAYDIAAEITPANLDPSNEQEAIEFTVREITDWVNDNTTDGDDDDSEPDHVPVN